MAIENGGPGRSTLSAADNPLIQEREDLSRRTLFHLFRKKSAFGSAKYRAWW